MENLGRALEPIMTRLKTLTPAEQVAWDERVRRQNEEDRRRLIASSCRALASVLGPRYAPERVSLDCYEIYHPAQQRAVDQLRATMATWPRSLREGCGIVLIGPPGTGKDHLLAAAAYEAICQHGMSCGWVSGLELAGRLRDLVGSKRETEGSLLESYIAPNILVVSDPLPPSGEITAYIQTALMRLIDARYRALKPTWMSVNAESADDAAARLGVPAFDRIREGAAVIQCYWPSFRARKKS